MAHGIYDLKPEVHPKEVAKKLLAFEQKLKKDCQIRLVFFLEVQRRTPSERFTPGYSEDEFRKDAKYVNGKLRESLGRRLIHLQDVRFPGSFGSDRIHLNVDGKRAYLCNLACVALGALRAKRLGRFQYFLYTRTKVGYFYHRREIAKAKEKFAEGGSHSVTKPHQYGDLKIVPIPMMMDNYAYIVSDTDTNTTIVVDPGDPEPVQKYLQENDIIPRAVLITHKHWDHSGGNSQMKALYPDIRIYGGSEDGLRDCTDSVTDGAKLEFGRLKFSVIFTPGHTTGHVVYLLDGSSFDTTHSLFSGDHLFLAGCGRMFEGSSMRMLKSLDSLQALNNKTLVWPGHEYAEDNLEFAAHIDPENVDVKEKLNWVKEQRNAKLCTSPSTIEEEKRYNPFFRSGEESLLRACGVISSDSLDNPSDEIRAKFLAELRERKDQFNYKL